MFTRSRGWALAGAIACTLLTVLFGAVLVLELVDGPGWSAIGRLAFGLAFAFLAAAYWTNWRRLGAR
jgi:hypothetical protein